MAQGYNTRGDAVTSLADGTDINALWAVYNQTLAIQNARRDGLVNFLSYPVASPWESIAQGGEASFEEASEFGVPRAQRVEMDYFHLGFGFKWYDSRVAYTWQYLIEADARQVDAVHNAMVAADNKSVFNIVMHTLFRNTNRSVDIRSQPYTVYALYNNDSTVPPAYGSVTFASSHTHYLTTGSATLDPGDVKSVVEAVTEHGYTVQNGHNIVLMVNKAEYDVLKMWRRGTTYSGAVSEYDFVPSLGSSPLIVPTVDGLIGTQAPNTFNGLKVAGSYGDTLIIVEDYVPASYMVAFATGGPDSLNNPVGLREHANAGLRGLKLIEGDKAGYPLVNSFYRRGLGSGIRHRGAAAVTQLTAGSYAIPANYATLP